MLTVTESAKEELRRILETSNLDPERYLRLAMPPVWTGEGDFGLVIDERSETDHAVDHEGMQVLLMDAALAEQLPSAVLDFKASPDGSRFTLDVF